MAPWGRPILAKRCAHLALGESNGKLRAMHAPRTALSSLPLAFALGPLALAACDRGGAPATPPPAPMSMADAGGADAPPAVPMYMMPPPADVSAPPADAERDPSGVARKILERGKGTAHPPPDTFVDLLYAGWERNGRQFEGMGPGSAPHRFDLKDLAPGLGQELQRMVE